MHTHTTPSRDEMLAAFLTRDAAYDGLFVTAVRTTGIFCRPTCPARRPRPENVDFFTTSRDALAAGFRPCRRCRPMEPAGSAPEWLSPLLEAVDSEPERRWTEADLEERGLDPDRVRRWFRKEHGMSFHAYGRARRLGLALGRIQHGAVVTDAAFDSGYSSLSGFNEAFRKLLGEAPREASSRRLVTLTRILTPLGPMVAGATEQALCLLEFTDRRMLETQLKRIRRQLDCSFVPGSTAVLDRFAKELEAYFAGKLTRFTTPLDTPGTEFQQSVWKELLKIPYGKTVSYGQVARAIGQPSSVRAVAAANGDNRIAIVIPCHRVIGSDGKLTGYGGGLWRKQRLLDLERGQLAF